ncbi:MAG: GTPase HflX, partial [Oceanospirillaceae bacterium]|nr:GTPase HflX [Oceanospirillaceae bacterium]
VGSGKVEEIKAAVEHHEAEIVIFNHALSPGQERNLEHELHCRVLDRTGLILDIFAQRARTHEGKLQVELAQLEHMSTRLVRGWTHLERQKGGIGLRGPGETQLETDRRLLRVRINSILKRLGKVRKQREQGRRARRRAEVPTISLVGYTNAGKSSLFNRITIADVYAADQLFATLDPTFRRLEIKDVGPTILVDTVGFIRHLPHKLVDAFRATLQETAEATLLLHLIDASDEKRDNNIEEVNAVLSEIGADELPHLLVYNKIDMLDDCPARIDRDSYGVPRRVWLSALTGEGVELLVQAISERLGGEIFAQQIVLEPQYGNLRAQLYAHGAVEKETISEQGQMVLDVRLQKRDLLQTLSRVGMDATPFVGKPSNPWD